MASTHIFIGSDPNRLQSELAGSIQDFGRSRARLLHVLAVLGRAAADQDYEGLAAALNLPATPEGAAKAQAIYEVITAAYNELTSADIVAMVERLG